MAVVPLQPQFQTLFGFVVGDMVHEMPYQTHAPSTGLSGLGHFHTLRVKPGTAVIDADETAVSRIVEFQAYAEVLSAPVSVMDGVYQGLFQAESKPASLSRRQKVPFYKRRGGLVKKTVDRVKPACYFS